MAVETLKGVEITNRDASPRVLNDPGRGVGARERCVFGHLASVPASTSTTSTIRLISVPSNCMVTAVLLSSEAQTAGAFDVGVYRTPADGGAVVDQDFFATAVSCAAAVINVDVLNEAQVSGSYTIVKQSQPLWQAVGMSADPKAMLDIVLTCATTAVTTGLGAIALRARFIQ